MKNLFKKKVINLLVKIYQLGSFYHRERQMLLMRRNCNINLNSFLLDNADIQNHSGDSSKIIIGSNSYISGKLIVYPYGGFIKIGDFCSLSENSRIVSGKKIVIGNRVMIAHNVNILDNISHPIDAIERHQDFIEHYTKGMQFHDLKSREIIIEDDVWIGFNSTIMKGVTIGRGAIIGANSIVTHDVEAWTVNVGYPLKVIRKLESVDLKI